MPPLSLVKYWVSTAAEWRSTSGPRRCHDASERRFAGVVVEAETSVGDPTMALGSGSLHENKTSIRDRVALDASDASRWRTRRSRCIGTWVKPQLGLGVVRVRYQSERKDWTLVALGHLIG
jgi:hypothetical protein